MLIVFYVPVDSIISYPEVLGGCVPIAPPKNPAHFRGNSHIHSIELIGLLILCILILKSFPCINSIYTYNMIWLIIL